MARANTPTLLSLDHYAHILGLSGLYFNQGSAGNYMPMNNTCSDIWFQHAWFHADNVSREQVAREIAKAEQEIADYIGYWPAPQFIRDEVHNFPYHLRPDMINAVLDGRGYRTALDLNYGKFIAAGQRNIEQLTDGLVLTYEDSDGDSYDEIARVEVNTTLTNVCEIKVFQAGHNADPAFEIRPALMKRIQANVARIEFHTWQMILETLHERFPTVAEPAGAIDTTVAANLNTVTEIEVYRVWCDFSQYSCQFLWEPVPLVDNIAGELESQNGVIHAREPNQGIVVPVPATYDADEEAWAQTTFQVCRAPDLVRFYYLAGDQSPQYKTITDFTAETGHCLQLSDWWAQTIAFLATARLQRIPCQCGNLTNMYEELMIDIRATEPDGTTYFLSDAEIRNPFGKKKGEIIAWERCRNFVKDKKVQVALI